MKTLGNILWFILGGWIAGTVWVLMGAVCYVTIIGIPFGTACFRIASFAYCPFGKELVDARDVGERRIAMTGLGNFLWVVLFGLWNSIFFILAGIAMCCGIVTIPFGFAYFKLAAAGFAPLGKRIVSTDMARVIRERKARGELDRRTGRGGDEGSVPPGTGAPAGEEPYGEPEGEEEEGDETGGDIFLRKVRLGRKLDAAMQESLPGAERGRLENIRDVYLAGVEAQQAGEKDAAVALYRRAEEAFAVWRKGNRGCRTAASSVPPSARGRGTAETLPPWLPMAGVAIAMLVGFLVWKQAMPWISSIRTAGREGPPQPAAEGDQAAGRGVPADPPLAGGAWEEVAATANGGLMPAAGNAEAKQLEEKRLAEQRQAEEKRQAERRAEEEAARQEAAQAAAREARRQQETDGQKATVAAAKVQDRDGEQEDDNKAPALTDSAKIAQAEIFIQRRDFDKAEALIHELGASNPKVQELSLSLGMNYFAIGNTDKARALYDAFFRQYEDRVPTEPDIKLLYRDTAYHYAQMLEMAGDPLGASAYYKRVEDIETDRGTKRMLQVRRAQTLAKAAGQRGGGERNKLLDEAVEICKDLQHGGLDVQYVDSVVVLANVELVRGNREKARNVLVENMDLIKPIDDSLAGMGLSMKDSPMAGARSLLARLFKEDAEAAANDPSKRDEASRLYSQALTEYYNVFMKYGDGSWGPTAGITAREIKGILESKYGKTVMIRLPEDLSSRAAGTEFVLADNLFRQQKYEEAAAEYIRVLGQFPDSGDISVGARAQLLQCYMNLDQPAEAKKVADELGARFAKKSSIPAKALVSAGALYDKKGDAGMSKYMFDVYLKYCPDDEQAGKILFWLASKAEQAGNMDECYGYLAKIITDYKEDQNYPLALGKRAWKAYADQDYEGTIEGMKLYIDESTPSPNCAQAMFALGASYRALGKMPDAIRQFKALVDAITPENNPYGNTPEDREHNKKLLEQARFYYAFCMSRAEIPDPAKDKLMKQQAIKTLDSFITDYPKSTLGAKALNLKGALQMAVGDAAANDTYAKLAREYPDTDEGKNAQFARIEGALGLGRTDQAKEALSAMLSNAKSYSVDEFVRVGQAMLEHEQWPEAAKAFQQVVDREGELASRDERTQRSILERAYYGLGEALYAQGNAEGANKTLGELMTRWPKSGLFFKAKFIIARASRDSGNRLGALLALKDIFSRAKEPELVNEAKLIYAQILTESGDDTQAFAIYKGIEHFSTANLKSVKERQQVSEAILAAIALGEKMERPADVVESCDVFLRLFPMSPKVQEIRTKRARATLQATSSTTGNGN